jgi:hypothetical protein
MLRLMVRDRVIVQAKIRHYASESRQCRVILCPNVNAAHAKVKVW